MNHNRWIPILILLFGILITALSQLELGAKAPLILIYSLLAPGLVFVRFLRVQDRFVEFTLAIALSIALNVIISEFMVFTRAWSPSAGLLVLVYISMAAALYELLRNSRSRVSFER